MKKQFWIMVKQFLLYLLLDQGVALPLMIPLVIYGVIKGYKGEAMQELLMTSSGALCVMILISPITLRHSVSQHSAKIPTLIFLQRYAYYSSSSFLPCW